MIGTLLGNGHQEWTCQNTGDIFSPLMVIKRESSPMTRFMFAVFVVCVPLAVQARAQDAKTQAQEVLDRGSALFDARDAAALAATYTEDARIVWVEKDKGTGTYIFKRKRGRSEIEALYRDLFKDSNEKTTSRNNVEFARFVAPDLMVINGTFQPNVADGGSYRFIQVRIKQGDKWLMSSLRIFIVAN